MSTVLLVLVIALAVVAVSLLVVRARLSPMVVIRPSVVPNVARYLGAARNDAAAIYAPRDRYPEGAMLVPFGDVVVDALDAMTVIHFAHAETLDYIGLEPQVYRTADGEILKRLFATTSKRTEGDLYVPVGNLDLNGKASRVSVPLDEARDTLEAEFSKFDLSITDLGLRADVGFTDRYGHRERIFIDEQRLGRPVSYRGMVAPATLATHEAYFPFIYLDRMAIAHKRSHVSVTRDGEPLRLHTIPVIGGNLIIYSQDAIGFYCFLAADRRPIEVHVLRPEQHTVTRRVPNFDAGQAPLFQAEDQVETAAHIERNDGFSEIKQASWAFGGHEMRLAFGPAIPDVLHLRDGARVRGRFATSVNRTSGVLSGTYQVTRQGTKVRLELQPKKVYQPISGDTWVQAYRWEGTIHLEDSEPWLESRWHKKKIRNEGLRVTIEE